MSKIISINQNWVEAGSHGALARGSSHESDVDRAQDIAIAASAVDGVDIIVSAVNTV